MKVCELIEFLSAQDPNAEVCVLNQPHFPIEHSIGAAVVRSDLMQAAVDSDTEAPMRCVDGAAPSDIVLVEGRWLRYGSRVAWYVRL